MATLSVTLDPQADALVKAAAGVLRQRHLPEAGQALYARLVRSGRLLAVDRSPQGSTLRLTPYAELVLREAIAIAWTTWEPAEKTARIDQALTIAGY